MDIKGADQGQVVQSIVSITKSMPSLKFMLGTLSNTMIFLVGKM